MTPLNTSFGVVLALWCAGLGAAAQFGKVSITFDALGHHYGAEGPVIGFVVSIVGLIGIFLGVIAGLIAARIGYRRAMVIGLGLGALMSLWQAMLPPLSLMLFSRAIEGVSHLAIVVAAPTLIAQVSAERHRGLTLSLWSTFFGVAFAILAWAGIPLVEARGTGALYAVHSAYMAAMAVLVLLSVPKDPPSEAAPLPGLAGLLRDHLRIYRSPFVSAPALGWVFYTACFVAILTIMPRFVAEDLRGWLIGAMPLAGIAVSMTLGVLLLRFLPAVPIVQMGFALSILFSVALWMAPGNVWPYLALAASMGLVQGASFAAVPQLNEEVADRAASNGAMAQTGNVGTTLGTPTLAALVLWLDVDGFLIFVLLMFGGGFLTHLILARRRHGADY